MWAIWWVSAGTEAPYTGKLLGIDWVGRASLPVLVTVEPLAVPPPISPLSFPTDAQRRWEEAWAQVKDLPPGKGIRRSAGGWAEDAEELDRYLEYLFSAHLCNLLRPNGLRVPFFRVWMRKLAPIFYVAQGLTVQ